MLLRNTGKRSFFEVLSEPRWCFLRLLLYYCALFSSTEKDKKKLLETRKRLEQCGQNFYQTCKVPTRKHHATTHQLCVSKAEGFIKVFQGQQVPIIAQVDNQRKLKVTNNRHVLTEILKLIHLLGKQNIAIRGKTDERSNFIVFLKALAEKDAILAEHLNSIKARKEAGFKKVKGAYTSHQIQNEFIALIGEIPIKS